MLSLAPPPSKFSAQERPIKKSALSLPAVQALLMQCVSFVALYAVLYFVRTLTGFQISLPIAILLQGAMASLLSRLQHLAGWWLVIQFLFPVALWATRALDLPSWFFLTAFLLLLGFYWTIFRTRVPLYLSGADLWGMVADLLPSKGAISLVDIGSGLGGFLLSLEKRLPDASLTGIELAPLPWLISYFRGRLTRSRVSFKRGDYCLLHLSDYDVVFAYLSPAVMESLWQKAITEMRPGTLLLSYEFPIAEVKPDIVLLSERDGSILYGWRIPEISHK